MSATEYIKDKLSNLADTIKEIGLRYEYDSIASVHVIEVTPKHIYEDDKYIELERNIVNNFIKDFSGENIVFISEDDIPGIRHEDFVIEGINHSPISSYEKQNINLNYFNITNQDVESIFVNFYSASTQKYCTKKDFTGIKETIILGDKDYHLAA